MTNVMPMHHHQSDAEDVRSPFGERLRQLRTEMFGRRGQKRFAEVVGIPQSSLGKYEKKVSPNLDALKRIVEATGADANWLLTGAGQMFAPNSGAISSDTAETRSIAFLGKVAASGFSAALIDQPSRLYHSVPTEFCNDRYLAAVMGGDEMAPVALDNDLMIFFRLNPTVGTLVSPKSPKAMLSRLAPFDGNTVVATIDGESMVRRLVVFSETKQVMLLPCTCNAPPLVVNVRADGTVYRGALQCTEFRIDGVLRLLIRSHREIGDTSKLSNESSDSDPG